MEGNDASAVAVLINPEGHSVQLQLVDDVDRIVTYVVRNEMCSQQNGA
jgi:hypothetical protein